MSDPPTDDRFTLETDGGVEYEWLPADGPDQTAGRSHREKIVATVLALLLAVSVPLALTGGATAHTMFDANDMSVTSNGGTLESLTVAPEGDVHYDGLEAEPESVDVAVQIREEGGAWETIATKSLDATGQEGTVSYAFDDVDVLAGSSLVKRDFMATGDGSTAVTTLEVRIETMLVGAGDGGDDVTASASDTFDVTVVNEPIGVGVGGQSNGKAD